MKKNNIKKGPDKKPSRSIKIIFSISVISIALLMLSSYYFNKFTRTVDILIISIALLLSLESFLYIVHTKKYKTSYWILSALFLLIALVHSLRLFFGPLQCLTENKALSVYLYEGLAIITGLSLVYFSGRLIKKPSGPKYHHVSGVLIGIAMIINHIIKIILNRCV